MDITLAILPFRYLESDERTKLLVEGFYYDLILFFSKYPSLAIISPESTAHIKSKGDYEEIKKLDVDYYLSGIFRSRKNKINFGVQLSRSEDSRIIFASDFEEPPEEMLHIQDEIAKQIVNALQQQIDLDIISISSGKKELELSAYENYLLGMNILKKGDIEYDLQARKYFEAALAIQPDYSSAYTGLSLSYFNEWSCQLWNRWEVSQKGAYKYALKALELNENDHIALAVAGRAAIYTEEYDIAEHYIRKSIAVNPNDADNLISVALSFNFLNMTDEALELYKRACKLNPMHGDWYFLNATAIYFELGDFEKVLELAGKLNQYNVWVDFPAYLAAAHFYLGDLKRMEEKWQAYLVQFSNKIRDNQIVTDKEAVEWQSQINPFKTSTKLQGFWNHIYENAGVESTAFSIHQKYTTPYAFLFKGGMWEISFKGDIGHIKDSKGLRDIYNLLSRQEEEIHCTELTGQAVKKETGIELIDSKAKKEYHEKIRRLQEDIKEAEEHGHTTLLPKLHEEYDQILSYLSSSVGLSGRSRTSTTSADRARSAVTLRIKKSIEKLRELNPELAKHLSASIKTGTFCAYKPEIRIDWQL